MSRPYYHRRSIRLKDYDYRTAGAYFVTVCAYKSICLFGEVIKGEMRPNAYRAIVREEWLRTAVVRPTVELDEFEVMPNHIHGILILADAGRGIGPHIDGVILPETGAARPGVPHRAAKGPPRGSVGAILGQCKSIITKRINNLRGTPGHPVLQRGYHEHIIRDEDELDRIRFYIVNNPARWDSGLEPPRSA